MGQNREIGQSGDKVNANDGVGLAALPDNGLSTEFFALELTQDKRMEWWLLLKEILVIGSLVAFAILRVWAYGY